MKDTTVDEILTRMFRDTADRIGWNTYRKGKRYIPGLKRRKDNMVNNMKKLH